MISSSILKTVGFTSCVKVVVDQLQQWQEATGAEIVIFHLRHAHSGGPSHEKILRAIRLFGDKVIPKLR